MMSSQSDDNVTRATSSNSASDRGIDAAQPNVNREAASTATRGSSDSGDDESTDESGKLGTIPTFDSPELVAGLKRYDAAITSALSDWQRETDETVLQPLRKTISATRDAAAQLLQAFDSSDHTSPDICRNELLRYRDDGYEQILVPWRGYLSATPPSREATSIFVDTLTRIEDAANELPAVAEIVDQVSGFESDPSDTLGMRLRKWNYRRRIRGGGDQFRRRVNARKLATYNSVIRIPQFLSPPSEAFQQDLAFVLAGIEKAISEWAASTLVFDRPLSTFVRDRVDADILRQIQLAQSIKLKGSSVDAPDESARTEVEAKSTDEIVPQKSTAGGDGDAASESTRGEHPDSTGTSAEQAGSSAGDSLVSAEPVSLEDSDNRAGSAEPTSLDGVADGPVAAAPVSLKGAADAPDAVDSADAGDTVAPAVLAVRSQTESLIAAFDRVLTAVPDAELPEPQQTNGARRALREDLYRAGTPFLSMDQRTARQDISASTRAHGAERKWLEWNNQIVDRFDLYATLFELRRRMLAEEKSILNQVARLGVSPVEETFSGIKKMLKESATKANLAATDARKTNDLSCLLNSIRELRSANDRFFSRMLQDLPGMVSADKILTDPGTESWQRIQNFIDSSPEVLTLHELQLDEQRPVNPLESTRTIELRARLTEAIQPVTKKLKAGGDPLRRILLQIWTDVEKVKTVVNYNLDTAISELTRITAGEESGDDADLEESDSLKDVDVGIDRTNELVIRGYERAAAALDDLLPSVLEPWNSFSETVLEEIQQQWTIVLRKARTGDPDNPDWDGFAAMARRNWQLFSAVVGEFGVEVGQRAKTWMVATRRRTKRLIRIGQTAVGAIEASDDDLSRSLDEMDRVVEIRRNLPLVYRHLFAFEPLHESTLFEGRSSDIGWIKDRIRRWQDGAGSAAIFLSAPVGSGRTTFLNIVSGSLLAEHPHAFVTPSGRLTEGELVQLVAEAINVPIDKRDATIADLEVAIVEGFQSKNRFVCLIDDLEHLVLKSAGGTDLLERFILLMSRTDAAVQWIATIGDLAWRYLKAAAGPSTSYPAHLALTEISKSSLESIVMGRHNRSAMPIKFGISQAQSDAMKRWLSRQRSDEEKQKFAQSQFFDRLYKQSGQNIALALYYWIRSASFSSNSDLVEIQPLEPLKFDALSQYALHESFSLEAFLFHKTLSLQEHNAVLRINETEGTMLIETLLNARLLIRIRSTEVERGGLVSDQILPGDRFRIRPLLINPIRGMLSQRHVVY